MTSPAHRGDAAADASQARGTTGATHVSGAPPAAGTQGAPSAAGTPDAADPPPAASTQDTAGTQARTPPTAPSPEPAETPGGPEECGVPGPGRWRPSRWRLRTRLAAAVMAVVLLMAAAISTFSTLTLRHALLERLDEQVVQASQRAASKRHLTLDQADGDTDRKAARRSAAKSDPQAGSPASGDSQGATAPPSAPADTTTPRVPPGLDAPGQSAGTLTLVRTADGRSRFGGYIDPSGNYCTLPEETQAILLGLAPAATPVTVSVGSLGEYRVLVSTDEVTGDTVVTGLSMAADNALIGHQLAVEAVMALVGAVIAVVLGSAMVHRSLVPLGRVASTARRVARLQLRSGDVRIAERVTPCDLASSPEVGQVGGALNTLLDHVEEALAARQRSETQVRQFVADASHELRTPLASIRGYTELIARQGADADLPQEAMRALARVHSESVRMTALVEDLLLLARLDAGRELAHDEVDLVGVVLDTVEDARAAGPEHLWEIDLAVLDPEGEDGSEPDFDTDPPLVAGDEARLRQVLVNLLANARVHTSAGTRVVTRLERRGGSLVLTVADDGPGIDPAVRERLFERFARGDSSRERRTGSTGLGMSIALAIVTSHGGA